MYIVHNVPSMTRVWWVIRVCGEVMGNVVRMGRASRVVGEGG